MEPCRIISLLSVFALCGLPTPASSQGQAGRIADKFQEAAQKLKKVDPPPARTASDLAAAARVAEQALAARAQVQRSIASQYNWTASPAARPAANTVSTTPLKIPSTAPRHVRDEALGAQRAANEAAAASRAAALREQASTARAAEASRNQRAFEQGWREQHAMSPVKPGATIHKEASGSMTWIPPSSPTGPAKRPKTWQPPTNAPAEPPVTAMGPGVQGTKGGTIYNHPIWKQNKKIPEMESINENVVRVMPPAPQKGYPDGYWVRHNKKGQPIDPSTNGTGRRRETHVPLPKPPDG